MGFKYDCFDAFSNDFFSSVDITETGSHENLLNIEIEINEGLHSIFELKPLIIDLYRIVEYHFFSSYLLEFSGEEMVFRFITIPQKEDYFVSGQIRISGSNYENLFRKSQLQS